MSNRHEWEFEYTAAKIGDGAEAQKAFRLGRVQWWRDQYAKVMAEIKESGLEVQQSIAAGYGADKSDPLRGSYISNSRDVQLNLQVNTGLQKKLIECHQKIQNHSAAVAEYEGWIQVMRANPEARLKLNQDDWLYFFRTVANEQQP